MAATSGKRVVTMRQKDGLQLLLIDDKMALAYVCDWNLVSTPDHFKSTMNKYQFNLNHAV